MSTLTQTGEVKRFLAQYSNDEEAMAALGRFLVLWETLSTPPFQISLAHGTDVDSWAQKLHCSQDYLRAWVDNLLDSDVLDRTAWEQERSLVASKNLMISMVYGMGAAPFFKTDSTSLKTGTSTSTREVFNNIYIYSNIYYIYNFLKYINIYIYKLIKKAYLEEYSLLSTGINILAELKEKLNLEELSNNNLSNVSLVDNLRYKLELVILEAMRVRSELSLTVLEILEGGGPWTTVDKCSGLWPPVGNWCFPCGQIPAQAPGPGLWTAVDKCPSFWSAVNNWWSHCGQGPASPPGQGLWTAVDKCPDSWPSVNNWWRSCDQADKSPHPAPTATEDTTEAQVDHDVAATTRKTRRRSRTGISPNDLGKLWNELADCTFPRVLLPLSARRQNKFRVALNAHPDPEWWRELIAKVNQTPFLRGENERGWRADLEFVVRRCEEIWEGKYDRSRREASEPTPDSQCPICNGDGWQYVEQNGENLAIPCTCLKRKSN